MKDNKQRRAELEAMAKRLGGTVRQLEHQATSPTGGEASGGISNTPLHLADVGSETYSQELGATLLENEVFVRDEVSAALQRLDDGTYGTCERCSKPIPSARLNALPYARHCVKCAAEVQAGLPVNLNEGRPLDRTMPARTDVHAAGTPGGGSAYGGLAGTTVADGSPSKVNLDAAAGGPDAEPRDELREGATFSSAKPPKKRVRAGKVKKPRDR
jgi:DnaK suppressor protein